MSDAVNVTGTNAEPTATPSAPATPATQGTPVPQSATGNQSQTATPQGATTPQQTSSIPEGHVPSYRLREAREAAAREAQTRFDQAQQQYQQEIAQLRSQVQALVGVKPNNSSTPEVDAIRQQFSQVFPELARLAERARDLESLVERAGDLDNQTSHYWAQYGRNTVDRLFDHASKSMGAPLTDEGKRVLHSAFVGFVQSSPELTERYANDPTIVDDFLKDFTSSFIDPVRRGASAQTMQRANASNTLPQDTPGGAPRATPAPQLKNIDERADAAWALYQQRAKQ